MERAFVASLCGSAWLRVEDRVQEDRVDVPDLAKALAPMLWVSEAWLADLLDESADEPYDLLGELLGDDVKESDAVAARHLLLVFYQRGMASPRLDENAVKWAWADAQRARLVRACYLAAPGALERLRKGGEGGLFDD